MLFASELRERIRQGRITCSVRIWTRPHVKVGGRYRMEHGEIEVTSVRPTSKDNRGIVASKIEIKNQRGEVVISYEATRMLAGRAA